MLKYILFGISGSMSGWFLRDTIVCLVNNINSTNGVLLNKFISSKDDFYKNTLNELKYCFDPIELKNGFNNYNIYIKENEYFVETLYMENWTDMNKMNEYIYSEEYKQKLNYLKNMNIFFSPSLFVLLKRYDGYYIPPFLKKIASD
ncbi:hypothetical protein YYC_01859 [Plasmodium yoelii 17X]|uniref:Uncharacterized protein n=3 Tax=Plasmodium yoelii TaxID=5861 RepID=Q7R7Q1_PLAYO|nr:conserved Plasmodium protein, unknown function [Plasmodium yoelii]EAA20019.1 hypothetical protein [Plasmodium yoelii yoelii]ETB60896.1 hypothetical protein YYC_01859 [Plasmodium yoelii 17X]CDU18956.1 conserved Plasmodium protein, unknown function [Plasmodium yoelii]VTZ79541.1 conserved Plasmodium protein, unknown function [Plasmodium yoelii]|eukprot:XP_728454.1 conserved Plasmodium protein, unknown function [Plasmodium yoelii]